MALCTTYHGVIRIMNLVSTDSSPCPSTAANRPTSPSSSVITVGHTILLLHGIVSHSATCRADHISLHHHQRSSGARRFPIVRVRHPTSAQTSIVESRFKCLVKLCDGINNLMLTFCNESKHTLDVDLQSIPHAAHFVRLLYARIGDVEEDADSVAQSCRRISLAGQLAQTLYAEKLPQGRTFQLDGECQPFGDLHSSSSSLRHMNAAQSDGELWRTLASELIRRDMHSDDVTTDGRPQQNIKYVTVVVTDRSKAGGEPLHATTLSGLGGGNLCLIRTCDIGLASWPMSLDMVRDAFGNDGRRRQRREDVSGGSDTGAGGCRANGVGRDDVGYASALGALCHELGHTFGLGHTRHGLMGDGFDYVARVFCVDLATVWAPERRPLAVAAETTTTAITVQTPRFRTTTSTTTTLRKPSTGLRLMQRFREQQNDADDRTWFEECSIAVLVASPWMRLANESPKAAALGMHRSDGVADGITVDWTNHTVTVAADAATASWLRLVEVRRAPDALMLMWWRFDGCGRHEFRIPVPEEMNNGAFGDWCWTQVAQIFVMNATGGAKLFERSAADYR